MTYIVGDAVHVTGLGKGAVREVLNSGRFRVEVKGRVLIVTSGQLTPVAPRRGPRTAQRATTPEPPPPESGKLPAAVRSLDLHGRTVLEAIQELQAFLNAALLDGVAEVRIIHGQSGGRIKAAVHAQLSGMPVRSFRLDPRNAGVTLVLL